MYNVVNERVPSYISDMILPLVRETTQNPLRIIAISCFPLLVRFLLDLVSVFYFIMEFTRTAENVNAFKYQPEKHKFSTSQIPLYLFKFYGKHIYMHKRYKCI